MSDDPEAAQPEAAAPPANEVEALKAEAADMRDRMLRALADAENTRRRAEREKQDASQYAIARFARDMLQIADNFARALAACPAEKRDAADPQVKAVLDGVEATERQLLQALEQHGVKPIDTGDGKFDPNLHQAMFELETTEGPPGYVAQVIQAGYMIGDRVLRPAMVAVSKAVKSPPANDNSGN